MSGAAILSDLRARGIVVVADGGRLRYRPVELVTDADRAALRTYKSAVLGLLEAECVDKLDDDEWYRLVEADLVEFGQFVSTRRYSRERSRGGVVNRTANTLPSTRPASPPGRASSPPMAPANPLAHGRIRANV